MMIAAVDPPPDDVLEFLLRPASYPEAATSVDLIETHISQVFLTERFVYKRKKPVRFEFLDFSTLDRRREACRDEVRLNRRLAGDAYLGLVPIRRNADGLQLGDVVEPDAPATADDGAVEWLVKMRRLDRGRMLDHLIDADELTPADVAGLAAVLADYYAKAPAAAISPAEYVAAVLHHVRANRRDLLEAVPAGEREAVRRIHAAQLTLLLRRPEVLEARVSAGRVIDGHGDLRPEHICLESPPVVYDCVEFSADLRRIDTADELTFLEMECAKLGRRDVGQAVFEAYVAASRDRAPAELRAFYESYRACVRAKVAALRLAQQAPHEAKATWSELRRDLETAAAALPSFGKPTLYVMRGLMGTGKSTLAAAVAEALAIERLRTDEIRGELFGPATSANDFDCGAYGPAQRRQVYKELARRCRLALSRGMSIVADGTFLTAEELATARGAAEASGAELRIVECRCPAEVAKARIARRLAEGRDPSEARPELYDRQAAAAFDSCEGYDIVVVDTTLPPEARLAAALRRS